jgi:hypothetical protein
MFVVFFSVNGALEDSSGALEEKPKEEFPAVVCPSCWRAARARAAEAAAFLAP